MHKTTNVSSGMTKSWSMHDQNTYVV